MTIAWAAAEDPEESIVQTAFDIIPASTKQHRVVTTTSPVLLCTSGTRRSPTHTTHKWLADDQIRLGVVYTPSHERRATLDFKSWKVGNRVNEHCCRGCFHIWRFLAWERSTRQGGWILNVVLDNFEKWFESAVPAALEEGLALAVALVAGRPEVRLWGRCGYSHGLSDWQGHFLLRQRS